MGRDYRGQITDTILEDGNTSLESVFEENKWLSSWWMNFQGDL